MPRPSRVADWRWPDTRQSGHQTIWRNTTAPSPVMCEAVFGPFCHAHCPDKEQWRRSPNRDMSMKILEQQGQLRNRSRCNVRISIASAANSESAAFRGLLATVTRRSSTSCGLKPDMAASLLRDSTSAAGNRSPAMAADTQLKTATRSSLAWRTWLMFIGIAFGGRRPASISHPLKSRCVEIGSSLSLPVHSRRVSIRARAGYLAGILAQYEPAALTGQLGKHRRARSMRTIGSSSIPPRKGGQGWGMVCASRDVRSKQAAIARWTLR